MPFAVAVSEDPNAARAAGEVAGQLLDHAGPSPDLVLVLVSLPHADQLTSLQRVLATVLAPNVLIGCATAAVLRPDGLAVHGPAVAAMAACLGTVTATAQPALPPPEVVGISDALLVLAHPGHVTAASVCTWARQLHGRPRVAAGLVASPRGGLRFGAEPAPGPIVVALPRGSLVGADPFLVGSGPPPIEATSASPPDGRPRRWPVGRLLLAPVGTSRVPGVTDQGSTPAALVGCSVAGVVTPADRGAAWHSELATVVTLSDPSELEAHHRWH